MLPRALRFKRPLHRCNACSPKAPLDGEDCVLSGISKWSQPTVTLRLASLMKRGGSLERLRWSLQGDLHPSLAATDGVRRWLRFGGPNGQSGG